MVNLDELNNELDLAIERLESEIAFAAKDLERAKKVRNCCHEWQSTPHWANSMVTVVTCKRCGYEEEQL